MPFRARTATISTGQCGGTRLGVPGDIAILRGRTDTECINTVGVTITVTIITVTSTISRRPDEYTALARTALKYIIIDINNGFKNMISGWIVIMDSIDVNYWVAVAI